MSGSLNGCKVLVTRPQAQGESLCRLIESEGGVAIAIPTLELTLTKQLKRQELLELFAVASHVIFVSRNAVRYADQLAGDLAAPLCGKIVIAVGEGTRHELAALDIHDVISPGMQSGSEELLGMPELATAAIRGCQILIVRGAGGRELLLQGLQARGAYVRYADVYERSEPVAASRQMGEVWHRRPDVIVVTSEQGLQNLIRMTAAADRGIMLGIRLVVMSPRIARAAALAGFCLPAIVASEQTDQGLLQAIRRTVE